MGLTMPNLRDYDNTGKQKALLKVTTDEKFGD